MKKDNNNISPMGLKGNAINERMKTLMGISNINENKSTSVVELTKLGPDGKVYGIVRENHEYFIKTTDKKDNLVSEDFKYIGGLQNKHSEGYPSYAKATKHLNLKFKSLAEVHNTGGDINVLENDNLVNESGFHGFSSGGGSGFSGGGNLEGNTPMHEEEITEEDELTEEEQAVEEMVNPDDVVYTTADGESGRPATDAGNPDDDNVNEHKLSIKRALENMDEIIDTLSEGEVKKKHYTIK